MIKPVITICLLFSLLFMIGGIATTIKTDPLSVKQENKKKKRAQQSKPEPAIKPIRFYPAPPAKLPDLNTGYLFNENRSQGGTAQQKGADGQQINVVDVKDVFYVGSIIVGETRKGLVSYPTAKKKSTASKAKRKTSSSNNEQVFLKLGDNLGGYEVTDVEPDKIVFKKGSDVVEKMLNDPDKQRMIPPKSNIGKAKKPRPAPPRNQPRNLSTTPKPNSRPTPTQRKSVSAEVKGNKPITRRSRTMTPDEIKKFEREIVGSE